MSAIELSCIPLEDRSDGAPGWCTEFAQASCESHYVTNIHLVRRPCIWLNIGCRASNATLCDDLFASGSPQSTTAHGGDATEGNGMAIWIGLISILLALALFVRSNGWQRLGLTFHASSGTFQNEELKCLHDEEEAGGASSGGFGTVFSDGAGEEAVPVACAAAHAVLDSVPMPHGEDDSHLSDGVSPPLQVDADVNVCEEVIGSSMADSVDSGLAGRKIISDSLAASKTPNSNDDIELPLPVRLRESFAAFDSGELVDELNLKMKAAEQPNDRAAAADSDSDDDGMARPYLASNKHLAMSLD